MSKKESGKKGKKKMKLVNFEVDEGMRNQLDMLIGYFGKRQSDILRGLITDACQAIESGEREPAIGSMSFDIEYGNKMKDVIDKRVPKLEIRTSQAEEDLNDLWIDVKRLQKEVEKLKRGGK